MDQKAMTSGTRVTMCCIALSLLLGAFVFPVLPDLHLSIQETETTPMK